MKTNIAILLAALSTLTPVMADILYVNNDTAYPADYRTFNDAFAAAAEGDTIMLAPSLTSYGDIVITGKSIKLIGNGSTHLKPLLQPAKADPLLTIIDDLFIGLNYASASYTGDVTLAQTANGTNVSGIEIAGYLHLWSDQCSLSGIDCIGVNLYGRNNVISRSVLSDVRLRYNSSSTPALSATGSVIRNSIIFESSVAVYNAIYCSLTLDHCILDFDNLSSEETASSSRGLDFSSGFTTLKSCIIDNQSGEYANGLASSWLFAEARLFNCLLVGSGANTIPEHSADNNNLSTTDVASVFDPGFTLQAGSPALGTGENGTDMGVFGGPAPFEWGGVPALPLINKLDILSADPTTGLTLRVEAEARD